MRDNHWLGLPPSYLEQIMQPLSYGAGIALFVADDEDGRSLMRAEFVHPERLRSAGLHDMDEIRARYAIHCQREARKLAASEGSIAVVQ